jgi:hypothetical protein
MTRSSEEPDAVQAQPPKHWWGPVLFPDRYLWLVFLSALDVMLTRVILFLGGTEVNPLAEVVIYRWGMPGLSVFKFVIVAFVIIACEYVGRTSRPKGRTLAMVGVCIAAFPVLWSSTLLLEMALDGGANEMLIPRDPFRLVR